MTFPLGSINLLEKFTALRTKPGYCWVIDSLQRILNDMSQRPHEVILRARSPTRELLSLWSLGFGVVAHGSLLIPQPGGSLNPLILGFYGGFISSHDGVNHWPLRTELNLPSPEIGEWFQLSNGMVGSPGNQLLSLGTSQSHLINTQKRYWDLFHYLGSSNDFRNRGGR